MPKGVHGSLNAQRGAGKYSSSYEHWSLNETRQGRSFYVIQTMTVRAMEITRDAPIPFFQIRSDPIQKILSIGRYRSNPILAQCFFVCFCFLINVEFLYFCSTLLCVKHNLLDNFILMKNNMKIYIGAVYTWSLHAFCNINPISQNTSGGGLGSIPDETGRVNASGC